jgi:hypothetical protein
LRGGGKPLFVEVSLIHRRTVVLRWPDTVL